MAELIKAYPTQNLQNRTFETYFGAFRDYLLADEDVTAFFDITELEYPGDEHWHTTTCGFRLIPKNVTNEAHGTKESSEAEKIAAEQSIFAAQQKTSVSSGTSDDQRKPFSETTDDGQVKSHFGTGEAY